MDARLENMLDTFVEAHSSGWGHHEWSQLIEDLGAHGIDTSDVDGIGIALENRRLAHALSAAGVSGLGPKRIGAIVEKFGTLYNLRNASTDEIAAIKNIHPTLAGKVQAALQ